LLANLAAISDAFLSATAFSFTLAKSEYCQIDFCPGASQLLRLRMCHALSICFHILQ
jgi:hypothetical protein